MRKVFILFLGLGLLLPLTACTNNGNLDPGDKDDNSNPDGSVEYVTVSFDSVGGSDVASITVEKGDSITPSYPVKEGYLFDGWYTDSSYTSQFYASSMITKDHTLYAKWVENAPNSITITFESEYGTTPQTMSGIPGEVFTLPTEPTDTFYDFLGWKVQGEDSYFTETTYPDEDLILVAQWEKNDTYQLTLETTMNVTTSYVFEVGSTVTLPTIEERSGSIFIGWYTDASFTEEFDATEPLQAHDYVLYERWETISDYFYTVSFQTDGGTVTDAQLHVKGKAVIEPLEPFKKGHIFLGWYADQDLQNEYHFDQIENDNIILWAKWEFNPDFTAVYLVYPDGVIDELFFDIGESYDLPIVERDGYIFNWWYTHVYGDNYNIYREYVYFPQPLGEDLILHALFTEAPNRIIVDTETFGGSTGRGYVGDFHYSDNPVRNWGRFQANPGDKITLYRPGKAGYAFGGWYLDEDCTIPVNIISSSSSYIQITAPNESTTIYAKWVEDGSSSDPDNPDQEMSILERLEDLGYECIDSICTYEESSGYTYTFNLDTLEFSYVIDTDTIVDGGYRYYDRSITIGPDYNLYYTYYVDENYGYQYYIELELEGNYMTKNYNVVHFYSNVSSEVSNVDKATMFIDNLVKVYQWIINE